MIKIAEITQTELEKYAFDYAGSVALRGATEEDMYKLANAYAYGVKLAAEEDNIILDSEELEKDAAETSEKMDDETFEKIAASAEAYGRGFAQGEINGRMIGAQNGIYAVLEKVAEVAPEVAKAVEEEILAPDAEQLDPDVAKALQDGYVDGKVTNRGGTDKITKDEADAILANAEDIPEKVVEEAKETPSA